MSSRLEDRVQYEERRFGVQRVYLMRWNNILQDKGNKECYPNVIDGSLERIDRGSGDNCLDVIQDFDGNRFYTDRGVVIFAHGAVHG